MFLYLTPKLSSFSIYPRILLSICAFLFNPKSFNLFDLIPKLFDTLKLSFSNFGHGLLGGYSSTHVHWNNATVWTRRLRSRNAGHENLLSYNIYWLHMVLKLNLVMKLYVLVFITCYMVLFFPWFAISFDVLSARSEARGNILVLSNLTSDFFFVQLYLSSFFIIF